MKFNLKKSAEKKNKEYIEKGDINYGQEFDDDHIDRRIQEEAKAEVPNEVTEKQLDKDRVETKDNITEKKLEKVRSGEADLTTEGLLNSSDSKLTKLRNEEAYTGDINKVEEQRLTANYVNEKEIYEDASETPEAFRWWKTKSPDGLKLASTDIKKK